MTVAGRRIPASQLAAYAVSRVIELGLIALGTGFVFFSDTADSDLAFLLGWDLLAVCYLAIGFVVVRRRRRRPDLVSPGGGLGRQLLTGARLSFGFTIAASLVGMGSVDSVLSYGRHAAYGQQIRFFGGIAIIAAWLLLHAGYARFYARRYYGGAERQDRADPASGPDGAPYGGSGGGPRGGGGPYGEAGGRPDSEAGGGSDSGLRGGGGPRGGLEFPRCSAPAATDFLYFSFTLGTSFAVSDVNVTAQAMRWHVMVHSVLSFFYNAVVLAVAIGILTGK